MTRPMTGQPETEEELTNATQKANAELSEKLASGEIELGFPEDDDDSDNLEDLREFREQVREEGNDELGVYGEPQTDDLEMHVTENGETTTYTREEWEGERGANVRTWDRLERNGGYYVRVARWFNDTDVNKVQNGRGFFGHKVGETEKALQFEVGVDNTHTAESETVWIPKKAARVHELQ